MKKLMMMTLMIGLVAFALTGCVKMHSTTEIKKDGSGKASLTFSISPSIVEAMKEMEELGMDDDQDMEMPSLDDFDKKEMEKKAKGHGVKIKKFKKGEVEGRETVEIQLEFDDLKGLSYVMGSMMGGDGGGMGIFDNGDGNLVLKGTEYDFGEEAEVEEEEEEEDAMDMGDMDPQKMQKQMEIMGKMMAAMGELDVRMEITVPGDIVSSNAPITEGRSSVWEINSGNMMTMDQDMEPQIVFSGKGLKIKPISE